MFRVPPLDTRLITYYDEDARGFQARPQKLANWPKHKKMARPTVDAWWKEQVFALAANEEGIGAPAAEAQLEEIGKKEGRTDWPSRRTIGRWLREYRAKSEHQKREYRYFKWPESMGGDLPWEASTSVLELIYALSPSFGGRLPTRPTIRQARWFWRCTLAAPDAPVKTRIWCAFRLCEWEGEAGGNKETASAIEALFAHAPWRSSDRKRDFDKFIERVLKRTNMTQERADGLGRFFGVLFFKQQSWGEQELGAWAGRMLVLSHLALATIRYDVGQLGPGPQSKGGEK